MAGLYVIIAGAGKVGWNLARELLEKGHEVTVLEQDPVSYTHLTLPTNREV